MLRIACLLIVSISLLGCSNNRQDAEVFGVPERIWNTLTPNQQNMIIKSYNKQKEQGLECKK